MLFADAAPLAPSPFAGLGEADWIAIGSGAGLRRCCDDNATDEPCRLTGEEEAAQRRCKNYSMLVLTPASAAYYTKIR